MLFVKAKEKQLMDINGKNYKIVLEKEYKIIDEQKQFQEYFSV